MNCPECKGARLQRAGFSNMWKARQQVRVQRYRCLDCGLLTTKPDNDVNKLAPEGKHTIHCLRCDHTWASDNIHPTRCAKCKSPYWDRLRDVNKLPQSQNTEEVTPGVN